MSTTLQENLVQNSRMWEDPKVWQEAQGGLRWAPPESLLRWIFDPEKGHLGPFLPPGLLRILELSPGAGRCTELLLPRAKELWLVDYSAECIRMCRERFGDLPHIHYFQNDGLGLSMVPDDSFDLFFCFDSMVHMDKDIVVGYIRQVVRKLVPNGLAYVHYSKAGLNPSGWRSNMSHDYLLERLSGMGLQLVFAELQSSQRDAFTVLRKGDA